MLPTFVIGLREGLEASLIVGIVAAFLRQRGRPDLIRWVFAGVSLAAALCIGVGVALDQLSKDLPQKQQEGLETVIGVFAVAMVSYMVIWMRRHSRDLKGQLEGAAGSALATGSAYTLVGMAFLAVLREGLETVVFLLAAFNESTSSGAGPGAALGIVVSIVLGYAIYRGGIKLNLSKFFRVTGVVLVLVAAGLVLTALHTAHEAGWLNAGQQSTVDLSSIVNPGSVQSSLLTGMLGVQPHPVAIELVGWALYAIPVGLYVGWPPGKGLRPRPLQRLLAGVSVASLVGALLFVVLAPSPASVESPAQGTTLSGSTLHTGGQDVTVARTGSAQRGGITTDVWTGKGTGTAGQGRPATMTLAQVAALGGGRLPIGLKAGSVSSVPVTYLDKDEVTAYVDPSTRTIVDVSRHETVLASVTLPSGSTAVLDTPVDDETTALPAADVARAGAALKARADDVSHRSDLRQAALLLAVIGVAIGLGAVGSRVAQPSSMPAPQEESLIAAKVG